MVTPVARIQYGEAGEAILSADPSVNPEDRKALVETLKQGVKTETKPEQVLRRKETAKRFGVTVKAVDQWARAGILMPIRLPGKSRAIGFRESQINDVIAGRKAAM